MLRRLGPLLVWVLLFGCNSNPLDNQALRNFAKTDTAFAVEAARNQVDTLMVKFLTKMYKRNPSQLPAGEIPFHKAMNERLRDIINRGNGNRDKC